MGMVDAAIESVAWRALQSYLMVKAVLIQPVRGGGSRHNRNSNLTERLMYSFYKGNEDQVWLTALEKEKSIHWKRDLQQKRRNK